jgi:hypothetical protein
MTDLTNAPAEAAIQHLMWALEEIKKTGNDEAARNVSKAVDALRRGAYRSIQKE